MHLTNVRNFRYGRTPGTAKRMAPKRPAPKPPANSTDPVEVSSLHDLLNVDLFYYCL